MMTGIDETEVRRLLRAVNEFGVTHIISSDGNMGDGHLDWVEKYMLERAAETQDVDRQLLIELRKFPEKRRYQIWEEMFGPSYLMHPREQP